MESIFSGRKISESSKLDGINYTLWSFKLGTILRGERVWQVVDLDILPQALGASGSRSLNAHAIPSDSRESSAVNTAVPAPAVGNTRVTTTPSTT
jgi:hypothetical protein